MNREIWFRILQVAVVAPYLYHLSGKQDGYFGIGLKLVAGSIIAMNVKPLLEDFSAVKNQAAGFLAQVAAAQKTLDKNSRAPVTVDAEISEAEFVES